MSKEQGHREHVHPVMLPAPLEIAVVKIQAKLECGKSAGVLYLINEGALSLGIISKEEHDLLARRYGRKLVDVIAEREARKEDSHIPILALEKQKEQQLLEQKDKQFRMMIEQWKDHPSEQWRSKVFADAEKWKDKLESARLLLAKKESAI